MAEISASYATYSAWKQWDERFVHGPEEARYFRREVGTRIPAGRSVVEIGYGAGRLLSWLRSEGYDVAGAEIQPELLEAAAAAGFTVFDLRAGPASALWAAPVDAFVAFDVLEHLTVPEIVEMLVLMHRSLRPGGRIVIRVPNGRSPFGLAFQADDLTHRTTLTPGTLAQIVDLANREMTEAGTAPGLRLTEVRNQAHVYPRNPRGLAKWATLRLAEGAFFLISLPYRFESFPRILYGANIVAVIERNQSGTVAGGRPS